MGSTVSRILGVAHTKPIVTVKAPAHRSSRKHSVHPALDRCTALFTSLEANSSFSGPDPASKQFAFFPKLPAELRLMIWELALPGERIVRIQEFVESSPHDRILQAYQCIGSKARVPTLLHVCHESRTLALKHYTIILKNRLLKPTYFNPDLDTLLFASLSDLFKFAQPDDLYQSVRLSQFIHPGLYHFTSLYNFTNYLPKLSVDEESIEKKVKHVVIGWSKSIPFNIWNQFTPWEEIERSVTLDVIAGFKNLDTLLVEDIYFEQIGVAAPAPPFADQMFKTKLMRRWEERRNSARPFPEIKIVGPTKMKQIRRRAREARLYSGQRFGISTYFGNSAR
ncbi:uncharacterized protein RCO7_09477 [Rhynchosporium graminicola]|uniref:2EXR domain-containing protein n=1 Tax=Rhynchosporium graminicola TaxID=2792576 RepID=A0A1E1K6D8_9HELO|nr:uncharacterized protein RCO7_09477 [Rhynchosporium commune]